MSEKIWVEHFKKMSQGSVPRQQGYYVVESYKRPTQPAKPKAKKRKDQLS